MNAGGVIGAFVLIILLVFGFILYSGTQEEVVVEDESFYSQYTKIMLGNLNTSSAYKYGGFGFVKMDDYWMTVAYKADQSYELTSYFDPLNLTDISYNETAIQEILPKNKIYITMNNEAFDELQIGSSAGVAAYELGKVLGTRFDIYNKETVVAITGENELVEQATCANITSQESVIYLTVANETRVDVIDNCVIVSGNDSIQIRRAANRLMFALVGIM